MSTHLSVSDFKMHHFTLFYIILHFFSDGALEKGRFSNCPRLRLNKGLPKVWRVLSKIIHYRGHLNKITRNSNFHHEWRTHLDFYKNWLSISLRIELALILSLNILHHLLKDADNRILYISDNCVQINLICKYVLMWNRLVNSQTYDPKSLYSF